MMPLTRPAATLSPEGRGGNSNALTLSHVDQERPLALADIAMQALAEMVSLIEVLDVRGRAEHLALLGRQAKDNGLVAKAAELKMRSERRLGELLIEAKERGELSRGGRPKSAPRSGEGANRFGGPETGSGEEPVFSSITLKEAGIDRKLSAHAQDLASKPDALFEAVVRDAIEKIKAGRAIVIDPRKDLNTREKALKRAARQAELGARQRALPEKKYGVIWEDPEWDFQVRSEAGKDRSAENHYPTTSTAELMERDIGKIAAPDCVRYVWATVPMLKQAIAYSETDGFTYKSHWIWDKVDEGTGYWNRNRHELLIVATRGSVPAPAPGTQRPSIMVERAREHSRKPDWAYEMVEADYPDLPKIELNARPPLRPGWDAWGYEVPDNETLPPSEGHEGEEAQERIPAREGGTEGSASPVHRSSGVDAQLPHSVHAEPGSSPRAGDEHELRAGDLPPLPAGADAGAAGNELPAPASPAPEPVELSFYKDLVRSDRLKGRHTLETARPIIVASRACDPIIPVKQLAEDLGHPLGTIKGWTHKCKVTDHARLQETARHATEVSRARHAAGVRP